jgi:hypothetical protein
VYEFTDVSDVFAASIIRAMSGLRFLMMEAVQTPETSVNSYTALQPTVFTVTAVRTSGHT